MLFKKHVSELLAHIVLMRIEGQNKCIVKIDVFRSFCGKIGKKVISQFEFGPFFLIGDIVRGFYGFDDV